MIEIVSNQQEIENLYKNGTNAPYQPVKEKFFGYVGVLLSDKNTNKVQCHICGAWKHALASHIAMLHGISSTEYKKKFGFPKLFPLCSTEHSGKMAEAAIVRAADMKKYQFKKGHATVNPAKRLATLKQRTDSPSHDNQFNLCKDQILKRINIVGDKVGHFPSQTEMEEHDSACLSGIIVRYKTWNNFKQQNTKEDLKLRPLYTKEKIIVKIRDWVKENKRFPVKRDFNKTNYKYPGMNTIRKHFGSWNRALQVAGLKESI